MSFISHMDISSPPREVSNKFQVQGILQHGSLSPEEYETLNKSEYKPVPLIISFNGQS
jgi:hypothetical protein